MTEEEKEALCDLIAFDIKSCAIMSDVAEEEVYWWLFDTDMALDDANNLIAARASFTDGLSISRT